MSHPEEEDKKGMERPAKLGAIVLCGGKSRRMGRAKAWLPFGNETLLQRIVRRISQVAEPICVVAAVGQEVPELPSSVMIVRDTANDRGPLQGIAAGLDAIAPYCERAYVSSTDVPFIEPAFIRRLSSFQLEGYDIVVPRTDGHYHPLGAIYACSVRDDVIALLSENRLRPFFLFERVRTLVADAELLLADEKLREADPTLRSLRNLNTPEEYEVALKEANR